MHGMSQVLLQSPHSAKNPNAGSIHDRLGERDSRPPICCPAGPVRRKTWRWIEQDRLTLQFSGRPGLFWECQTKANHILAMTDSLQSSHRGALCYKRARTWSALTAVNTATQADVMLAHRRCIATTKASQVTRCLDSGVLHGPLTPWTPAG